ncbi:MAG: thermonuclease family protein [Oscillatoriales cyanobacterium RM2_1_1]|nr:thermonuclease family protein [Oscillatoriales cyanobacterium RM2_1_1]
MINGPKLNWLKLNPLWSKVSLLKSLLAIGLSICLISCSTSDPPTGITAKVERVISGQALEVITSSGGTPSLEKVRLLGIMAPDLKQEPWGFAAKQSLEQACLGQQIVLELETDQRDRFDRVLAYVWSEGTLINEQLVRDGFVLAEDQPAQSPYNSRLQYAQQEARILERGIWNPENPLRMTPEEFRQQQVQN